MSDPFVGEIRMFGGNYAPQDWAFCNGQLLAISDYQLLYTVISNAYGGDGQTTFRLPDLRGRVPLHVGSGFNQGQIGGQENVSLLPTQLPAHNHVVQVSNDSPSQSNPRGNIPGQSTNKLYRSGNPTTTLAADSLDIQGGSQSHANLQPYLCVNFIIALQGLYPQQN